MNEINFYKDAYPLIKDGELFEGSETLALRSIMVYYSLVNLSLSFVGGDRRTLVAYGVEHGWRFPLKRYASREYEAEIVGSVPVTVAKAVRKLCTLGILKEDTILIPEPVVSSEYFPLKIDSGLKGLALILYSYVYHRADLHESCWIDEWHSSMAKSFCMTPEHVKQLFRTMYDAGLARCRTFNGKHYTIVTALERERPFNANRSDVMDWKV